MATDLMKTSNKKFSKYIEKYKNFMTPSCNIIIEGRNISKEKLNISSVSVKMSINGSAGSARFLIQDCYDYENKEFDSEIKSKLRLGSTVSIELGYEDECECIFKGYIESTRFIFNNSPSVEITCMDYLRVLMQNTTIEQKDKTEKLSQQIENLIKKLPFVDDVKISMLEGSSMQEAQHEKDIDFIKSIAKRYNYEFFCVAGNIYFRPAKENPVPITTLSFGESVINFEREVTYKNIKVTVYSKKADEAETISASAEGRTDTAYIKNSFLSNKVVIATDLDNETELIKRAEDTVARIIDKRAYTSDLTCIGIPEIVPGRYIKLKDFDDEFDGSYYITEVTHSFSSGAYTTSARLSSVM